MPRERTFAPARSYTLRGFEPQFLELLHVSSFVRRPRSVAIILGLCAVGTIAARPIPRPPRLAPGVSFKISFSSKVYPGDTPRAQDDEVMRGRGVAVDGHSRIEFLAFTPAPQGITTDDFLIGTDSGKAYVLHASSQHYTTADDMFNGPGVITLGRVMGGGRGGFGGGPGAGGNPGRRGGGGPPGGRTGGGGARGGRGGRRGGGGGVGGFVNQIQLLDVNFKLEKLGTEQIDGRDTQHYRITTDYRVIWADQAFPAHAVTEIWTAQLPTKIPNPFEPLIVTEQSTDGPLIEYALKLRAIRAQLEGTPVKVATTTTFSNIRDIVGFQGYTANDPTVDKLTVVQQTAITGIQPADVDPKLVAVPDNLDPGSPN